MPRTSLLVSVFYPVLTRLSSKFSGNTWKQYLGKPSTSNLSNLSAVRIWVILPLSRMPLARSETFMRRHILVKTRFFDMCGVCDEWRAANEVCRATSQVIEYLEDVQWHVEQGTSTLAIAHVHHTLKYQQDRLLALWYVFTFCTVKMYYNACEASPQSIAPFMIVMPCSTESTLW